MTSRLSADTSSGPADSLMHPDRSEPAPGGVSRHPRPGFVALLGLPNAGKSTLLNALVGEHLSIATPRAQTTWQRVAGIRTEEASQMVFLDTPGIVTTPNLFHRSMALETDRAAADGDVRGRGDRRGGPDGPGSHEGPAGLPERLHRSCRPGGQQVRSEALQPGCPPDRWPRTWSCPPSPFRPATGAGLGAAAGLHRVESARGALPVPGRRHRRGADPGSSCRN